MLHFHYKYWNLPSGGLRRVIKETDLSLLKDFSLPVSEPPPIWPLRHGLWTGSHETKMVVGIKVLRIDVGYICLVWHVTDIILWHLRRMPKKSFKTKKQLQLNLALNRETFNRKRIIRNRLNAWLFYLCYFMPYQHLYIYSYSTDENNNIQFCLDII